MSTIESDHNTSTLIAINEFDAAVYNPRTMSIPEFESLQRSIDENGFVENIVLNDRQHSDFPAEDRRMTLISGHMRTEAAKALGYTELPAVVLSVSPAKEKALNLAMNRISGSWDEQMLAEVIAEINALEPDQLNYTGFDEAEINRLIEDQLLTIPKDPPEETDDGPKKFSVEQLRDIAKSMESDPLVFAFLDAVAERGNL